ncbi:short-chain dehydrogenase [Bordetella sp. H567]|uniref:SDR family oxidoreductase n=1 Tax=Bordetella sp. H567 TaxID=1697043 RepID=UPI00081D0C11|nr:SDR family oxidoreductase [Bordetella sp. H567]AOB32220.1 short-chain dehydrogenase [Bordetella sp. H567]
MEISLQGRTAIVTGASKGLGHAIADRFVQCGANVVIAARTEAPLQAAHATLAQRQGGQVHACACDVSTAQGVQNLYDSAMKGFGRVDIIVNNAGTSAARPFGDVTDQDWQDDLDLKLFAAIRLTRLVWPQMKERRWGRVVNVLNIGAKAPGAKSVPTSVSRAAGMALTKALSAEGAPDNILVNALLVGKIESDQWVRRADARGVPVATVLREMAAGIPLGRVGRADEFAAAACFLASDWASYITGTAINVDGGASPVV